MAQKKDIELNFDELPKTEDGTPYIEVGDEPYTLPFHDLLDQSVDPNSLADSIRSEGIEYPIIVDQDNRVIDGMTRLMIAYQLDLDDDEIPIEETEIEGDGTMEKGWWKALELNASRRQLTPGVRRQLIQEVMARSSWRSMRSHVSDFARMFGVSKSTISRDIDEIEGGEESALKREKRSVNQQLTGIRSLRSNLEEGNLRIEIDDNLRKEYGETLDELLSILEEERAKIDGELDEAEQG